MALHSLSLSDRRKFFRPSHTRIYINVKSNLSRAISGPPSALALFTSSSETLWKISKFSISILIGSSLLLAGKLLKMNARIISTSSGVRFAPDTLSALLPLVVNHILQNPLYSTKTLQALITSLGKAANVSITAFGPTNVTKPLKRTLKLSGLKRLKIPLVGGHIVGESDHIAIIGMSCKLPGRPRRVKGNPRARLGFTYKSNCSFWI